MKRGAFCYSKIDPHPVDVSAGREGNLRKNLILLDQRGSNAFPLRLYKNWLKGRAE
jgi:hypothetical protein